MYENFEKVFEIAKEETRKLFEANTWLKALSLPLSSKVKLWNFFVEESAWYGEDSQIFDLEDEKDLVILARICTAKELVETISAVIKNDGRYFRILDDGSVFVYDASSMNDLLNSHWGEIIDRVMSFPSCYYGLDESIEDYNGKIMPNVFEDVIRFFVGVPYKENNL